MRYTAVILLLYMVRSTTKYIGDVITTDKMYSEHKNNFIQIFLRKLEKKIYMKKEYNKKLTQSWLYTIIRSWHRRMTNCVKIK